MSSLLVNTKQMSIKHGHGLVKLQLWGLVGTFLSAHGARQLHGGHGDHHHLVLRGASNCPSFKLDHFITEIYHK